VLNRECGTRTRGATRSAFGATRPACSQVFVAILKKHSDYGRPAQSDVSFSRRELARLVGRDAFGVATATSFVRALNEIHYTFVRRTSGAEVGTRALVQRLSGDLP